MSDRYKDDARLRGTTKVQAEGVTGLLRTEHGPERARIVVGEHADIDRPVIVRGDYDRQQITGAQRRRRRGRRFGGEVLPVAIWASRLTPRLPARNSQLWSASAILSMTISTWANHERA
jgi:hypothetical protein